MSVVAIRNLLSSPNILGTIRKGKMIWPHIYGQYDKEGLHSFGKLRGVLWQLVTDIARPAMNPILKNQAVEEEHNETSDAIKSRKCGLSAS
jgi:hypothetical protein